MFDNTALGKRGVLLFAGVCFLQCGVLGVAVAADTTTIRSKASAAAVESFWTEERMEEAVPLPFYDEEADLKAIPSYLYRSQEPVGTPGSTKGGPPKKAGSANLLDEEDAGLGGGDELDFLSDPGSDFGVDFGTKDEFDSYPAHKEVWNRTVYPWRAVGKLYLKTQSGAGGSCSASVIGAKDAIVTAAHCCYDRATGKWLTGFAFAPGKDGASEPYGRFAWSSATVLTAWITSGGRQNDVCVIKTRPGLSSTTGWLGRSWNQPQTEHVFTFGYPGNKDSGLRQNVCASENYPNCGSSLVNATGCDKTYGDSGAPWIRVYRPRETGAKNFVNSVTSGIDSCTGSFGKSYNGARFTSNNIVPICKKAICD